MRTLTPAERRAFRAKAHHLHPFVSIGQHGLTPAVLHEIGIALAAHELIKIRVFNDDRAEREALLARIDARTQRRSTWQDPDRLAAGAGARRRAPREAAAGPGRPGGPRRSEP
jgi:RNA-binding protein YhbY